MIRIAIVEDDTGYRSQLGKYIEQYQSDFSETVSVSEFSDGLEIVEKYKSEYDIILMDIQMKHMDGMQAAMRIRDTLPSPKCCIMRLKKYMENQSSIYICCRRAR